MQMSVDGAVNTINTVADVSNNLMIAANSGDFGGFIGPVVGLLSIGAFIVVLSPPLKDGDE